MTGWSLTKTPNAVLTRHVRAQVMTPSTPSIASAAEVSIDTMRACACGEPQHLYVQHAGHCHVAGIFEPARDLARRIDARARSCR